MVNEITGPGQLALDFSNAHGAAPPKVRVGINETEWEFWTPHGGGGYVSASDHSLHDGIPIENIRELSRVGREYGGSCY